MALNREKNIKYRFKVGEKIGYWTVIKPVVFESKTGKRKTLCRCICGKEKAVLPASLGTGKSLSCGCRRAEKQSDKQQKGKETGHDIMREIHAANAAAGLPHALNRNSSTGYTGVSYMKQCNKYRAYITLHRKQISLGLFEDIKDAINARKDAEIKYFGEYREIVKEIKEKHKKEEK